MGLREDAIKAHERQQEKFRMESEDRLAEKREGYRKTIVEICNKAFGRDPDSITVDENGNRFTIEDLTFLGPPDGGFYGDKWRLDLGICPECDGPIYNPYTFALWNRSGEVVLASVGDILEDHAAGRIHSHPIVDPDSVNKTPPPPPPTATYRLDSPEYRILEALQDLMRDAIEYEREGR